ncbi:MAG TPA: hypothetical protein VMD92_15850 [Acidobacteriaceae bacterium]|nr:hypothetical protein [Acidobacteriaceae bacterium]HTW49428.1 hypothetical protein [Acidobacteriaceae bacterium]
MDRKKLLTASSVVGLLACGACFLPPPRPPRMHPLGSESVYVKVTDLSQPPLVDGDAFGRSVAQDINAKTHRPTARCGGEVTSDDAVLQVFLIRETATAGPSSPGAFEWTLTFTTYATLSAPSGASPSQLPSHLHRWKGSLPESAPELAWRDPKVRYWLDNVANEVSLSLVYGDPASR